ncbi:MAG: hypothetical protein FWF88_01020, partial [Peptococcaceae bacterium]|nr:hypothetical protein [Peptococcaceae bacterium]
SIMNHRQHGQISIALSTLIFIAAVGAACLMGASTATAGMDANQEAMAGAQAEAKSAGAPETTETPEAGLEAPETTGAVPATDTKSNSPAISNPLDPCGNIGNWVYPGSHNWKIVNGKLAHEATPPKTVFAHLKDTVVADGTVSAKIIIERQPDESDYWGGLAVRQEAGKDLWSTGYLIIIQSSKVQIYKGGHGILGSAVPANVTQYNDWSMYKELELKIVMAGDRIDVYVNGEWVRGFNDDTYKSGSLGPVAMNAKVYYSDFTIVK